MIQFGSNKGAEINAAITAASSSLQTDVELSEGIFYIETPIVLKNGVHLVGQGRKTIIVPTYTGGADDPTNCIIQCVGTLSTSLLNTTFSVDAVKGESSVTLTSAGSLVAGSYFVAEGVSGSEQGGPTGGTLGEISKVASSYVSGTTVPLAWAKYQTNDTSGITVKGVVPVVNAGVRDLTLLGGTLTATGLYAKYAVDVYVDNVAAEGFSRGAIDVESCVGLKCYNFYNLGGSNSWFYLNTVCGFDIAHFNGKEDGTRVHASGLPRAQFYSKNRCTSGRVRDGVFTGGYAGVFHSGGVNLSFSNLLIRNQEITQAIYDRAVAGGEYQNGGKWALGFGSGHGPLALAEFAYGCSYRNIVTEDLVAPSVSPWNDSAPRRAMSFYIHDTVYIDGGDLKARHFNASPVCGFVFSDTDGTLQNIQAKGTAFGFTFENFNNYLHITGVRFDAVRATAGNAPIPFYFNYDPSSAAGPRLRDVVATNAFSFFDTGASQTFDYTFSIENLNTDGGQWQYVVMANNQSGTDFDVGDIVEIDSAHTGTDLRIVTPNTGGTDYKTRLAVVVGVNDDLNTGYCLIAPLPQNRATVKATSAAVAYGDRMSYAATRRVVTAAGEAQPLGKALQRKANGAEGLILIGSAA
jgi:hypothetical protein